MVNLTGCSLVSDLLQFPINGEDWSEHFFAKETDNKYVIRLIFQPGGDLALQRFGQKAQESRPWKVSLQQFKETICSFTENTLLDFHFSKHRKRITSFIIKTHYGQICHHGGNLYFRNIKNRKKLQQAMKKLDDLFPLS